MGGVGFTFAAIQIALAHDFRREFKPASDAIDNLFDDKHALRAAKSAEGGVGRKIGFGDLAAKFDGRNIIGVVEMEKSAVGDGLG